MVYMNTTLYVDGGKIITIRALSLPSELYVGLQIELGWLLHCAA